jgi:hypothetical protein
LLRFVSGASYDGWVPKPLELPADLIALHRVALEAEDAIGEYVAAVQARRRAEHPDDVVARCTWTAEESTELDRLYEAHTSAALAVREYPLLEQARVEGCHAQTWQALKEAARAAVAA